MFRSVRKSASAVTGLRHVFSKRRDSDEYLADDEETKRPMVDEETAASSVSFFNAFDGRAVPPELEGLAFAFEVGGVREGWLLDCGDGDRGTAAVTRFAAGAAPAASASLRYRDEATFLQIERKRLSVTAAMMTGKLAASGDVRKLELLDAFWDKAKAEAFQGGAGGGGGDGGGGGAGGYVPTAAEEEAQVVAALAPRAEPTNACTAVFWKRHFGTDALVGSWLFLISSIFYLLYAVDLCVTDASTTLSAVMSYGNLVSAIGFTVGSAYFIKLSYPEVAVLIAMRAMREDVSKMSLTKRYVTHNEMLLAIWGFQLGFAPYLVIGAFYIVYGYITVGVVYIAFTVVSMGLMGFWLLAAMPENMQKNGGQGSSFFYDKIFAPLCCVKKGSGSDDYFRRHLGNDFLAGAWIFCVFGVSATVAVTAFVVVDYASVLAWASWLMTVPFGVGSVLFVRSSYPDTMNSSICCGPLSYEEDDHYDAGWRPPKSDSATPLIP